MRRLAAVLTTVALVLPLTGCDQAQDLAQQAQDTVEEGLQTFAWCSAAFRLGRAVSERDVDAARSAAGELEANAPEELQGDVDTVIAAIEAAEAGDTAAIDGEEVRAAGQRVLDGARSRCDPTTDPGN